MHLVLYHQQTTRKKGHHDSWHFLCASLTVYVSSLHLEHMTCYRVRIVPVVSSYRHDHDHKTSYIILRYILYIIYL
jgi:hypothetical protein